MAKSMRLQKTGILSEFIEVRQKIIATALELPPRKQEQVFLGQWTAKDLLGHLSGWDCTNDTAAIQILAGQSPDFFSQRDKDWQTYNAWLVKEYGRGVFDEVVNRVRQSHKLLITRLSSICEEDFIKTVPHGKHTISIATLMKSEIKDEWEHLRQLETLLAG